MAAPTPSSLYLTNRRSTALVFSLTLLASTAFLSPSARAAFLFCNKTQNLLEAAIGYRTETGWTSEGWWQLQPGQCARVLNQPLSQRFYFYYARSLAGPQKEGSTPPAWEGKYAFCIDNKAFKIDGDTNCDARGYKIQGFREADIGTTQRDYTLTFQGEP